jgi:formiminotetrahydrofolate cyclodeaminase
MSWGIWGGLSGPMAVPATYTVKLVVDGQKFSRKLNVKKDPHSAGTIADIQFQVQMALEIRDNTNTVVDSINRIEQIRKQIHDFAKSLKGDKSAVKVIAASKKLDEKIVEVEGKFFQKILAEGDLKSFRAPVKLYSQLALLAGDVAQGSADFPPTAQQIEVHEELKKELIAAQSKLNEFIQKDIAAFNTMLKKRNMPAIITKNF